MLPSCLVVRASTCWFVLQVVTCRSLSVCLSHLTPCLAHPWYVSIGSAHIASARAFPVLTLWFFVTKAIEMPTKSSFLAGGNGETVDSIDNLDSLEPRSIRRSIRRRSVVLGAGSLVLLGSLLLLLTAGAGPVLVVFLWPVLVLVNAAVGFGVAQVRCPSFSSADTTSYV